jgi:chromosome segregation protein
MKIAFVELAGFRGCKESLRLTFPSGFAVITGRNGAGKSTICDAVEYALTGSLSKYDSGAERGESVADYLWWRGSAPRAQQDRYVELGLVDEEGTPFVIRRGPEEVPPISDTLGRALCDLRTMPTDPLSEMCRTSIIRDETLAAFSVDIKETQRFALVRSALGTSAFEEVASRRKSVSEELKKKVKEAEVDYSVARQAVTNLLSDLSEARTNIRKSDDVKTAEHQLAGLLGVQDAKPEELARLARLEIARSRQTTEGLMLLRRQADQLLADRAAFLEVAAPDAVAALEERLKQVTDEVEQLTIQLTKIGQLVKESSNTQSRRASLAALHEHGRLVGLVDGLCPLCQSALSEAAFTAGLGILESRVGDADLVSAKIQIEFQELQARLNTAATSLRELRNHQQNIESERRILAVKTADLLTRATQFGLQLSEALTVESIDQARLSAEHRLTALESSTAVMDASVVLDRIADLEQRVDASQRASTNLERRLREVEAAQTLAKNLGNGVQRAIGEMLEERLAALDPLLKDLYGRLRPHVDWTELHYRLRGDVQRLLSLSVGEDINPRFTFSSGQRRAMGLAFLLAVHLSRPWCKLKTLVLDDPIQHIDDFRALHFVEVLTAIRKLGQQIICVVEDQALAEAMCRRLRSEIAGDGVLIEMAYTPNRGIGVADVRPITPAIPNLVLSA